MSAQGLKQGDQPPVDTKPGSRRRGAAGRAAALRRAPSDSDASAETASLSADSERRAPPPVPSSGKARNRRRGSEWEVLEGLKDGQRFERRPEVFNGFLHKKRKWPLKGWHKRFFVVDGGILVYARSPTDVARGRLHGSLDVGLSVISAKPRRRRIDIDADEFIYHLRAKTPDVFRTWLTVLKAHRLYRQHLLTFGARESVPKIHAPMDDLPTTEPSSRITQSSVESFSSITCSQHNLDPKESFYNLPSSKLTSSVYRNSHRAIETCEKKDSKTTNPRKYLESTQYKTYGSLCSMYCIEKRLGDIPMSAEEQQIHSTNLDLNTLNSSSIESQSLNDRNSTPQKHENILSDDFSTNDKPKLKDETVLRHPFGYIASCINNKDKWPVWTGEKDHTTVYLFTSKKSSRTSRCAEKWAMKRSKKSTNVVKYRNCQEEPSLKLPLGKQMLLGKCKDYYETNIFLRDVGVSCDLIKNNITKGDKATQDEITASDYDAISETILLNLLDAHDDNNKNKWYAAGSSKCRLYVNQVVRELFNIKFNDCKIQPIKFLFKTLMQYYLKNTEGIFKSSIQHDVSISKQSNAYFTKDKKLSNLISNSVDLEVKTSRSTMYSVQELEQFVKSTAYSGLQQRTRIREKDIEITKTLINKLDTISTKCIHDGSDDVATSDSSELPQLQDTIKHLVSESSLTKAIAKDFLNAYLGVLRHSSSKSTTSIADSSDTSKVSDFGDGPTSGNQIECAQASNNDITANNNPSNADNSSNTSKSDQLCSNEKHDKIDSGVSYNSTKIESKSRDKNDNSADENNTSVKDEVKKPVFANNDKNRVYGVPEDNMVVIDLSEYELDTVAMSNHATVSGGKCLIVTLKEKCQKSDIKLKNLSLKFTDNNPRPDPSSPSKSCYQAYVKTKNPFTGVNPDRPNRKLGYPRACDNSKATSKTYSQNYKSHQCSQRESLSKVNDNAQSYVLCSIKEDMPITSDTKKKLEDSTEDIFSLPGARKRKEPKVIDEKFILSLLENLTLLSKETPCIHTDINNLYLKLKKRYEETKCLSGLRFLGNIYKRDTAHLRKTVDDWTQIDPAAFPKAKPNAKKGVQIAINTSFLIHNLQLGLDKALSAIMFAKGLANFAVQTRVPSIEAHAQNAFKSDSKSKAKQSENEIKDEWMKTLTRDYTRTAVIKCILQKYHQQPQSIRIAHPIRVKVPEAAAPINSSLASLSTSSPPLKISTQSQMKVIQHSVFENNIEVYQLFACGKSKMFRSESWTDSSVDVSDTMDMSDDLKTLYRCSSEPSYCSGLFMFISCVNYRR